MLNIYRRAFATTKMCSHSWIPSLYLENVATINTKRHISELHHLIVTIYNDAKILMVYKIFDLFQGNRMMLLEEMYSPFLSFFHKEKVYINIHMESNMHSAKSHILQKTKPKTTYQVASKNKNVT